MANISSTMGVQGGRLCMGEASRGDIGCPVYAPSVSMAGDISVTGNLQAAKFIGDGSLLTNLPYPSGTTIISGTTTMKAGWPDALLCGVTSGNDTGYSYVFLPVGATSSGGFIYRIITPDWNILQSFANLSSTGSLSSNYAGVSNTNCGSKTISQLYAEGKAFNFIGGSGSSTAMGDRLTSGTLAVTANSSTAIVSLSTAGTTWGYLGSNASYLPNLSSNNISASILTVGGLTLTSSSLVSTTAQVAFSVHKNGVNQTVASTTPTKMTWVTEDFDTNNNFTSSAFTTTVAGSYLFNAGIFCSGGTACYVMLYKNGANILQNGGLGNAASNYAFLSHILSLNAGDIVEVYAQNTGGTSIAGNTYTTRFSGVLLNGGSGGSDSAGVSAMSSLTDVTLTSPAANSVLVYDGAKWVNKFLQDTVSNTTMLPGWPDAIKCESSTSVMYLIHVATNKSLSTQTYCYPYFTSVDYAINYSASGTYNSNVNMSGYDCVTSTKSISQLYTEGLAYNFLGGSGSSTALGDRLTSGTLAVTANSVTSIVSLSTAGTTWGYLGSNASYLPNLSAGAISATNISISTINGIDATNFGGSPVAFSVHKNGTNQTVADGVVTKLTWSTEEFDTNNNFASNAFTATVPGTYAFNAAIVGSGGAGYYVYLYKNGVNVLVRGVASSGSSYASVSHIMRLNTGDTVEVYALNNGGTTILGPAVYTRFSGALINAGGSNGDSTPTGAIMAFDLATCPTGWSEYIPARGRFLRGIDNGAGNDPSGTRVAGSVQADDFKSHTHQQYFTAAAGQAATGGNLGAPIAGPTGATGGAETRPKNVAVLYCRKD